MAGSLTVHAQLVLFLFAWTVHGHSFHVTLSVYIAGSLAFISCDPFCLHCWFFGIHVIWFFLFLHCWFFGIHVIWLFLITLLVLWQSCHVTVYIAGSLAFMSCDSFCLHCCFFGIHFMWRFLFTLLLLWHSCHLTLSVYIADSFAFISCHSFWLHGWFFGIMSCDSFCLHCWFFGIHFIWLFLFSYLVL